jgi:hypothetical protein
MPIYKTGPFIRHARTAQIKPDDIHRICRKVFDSPLAITDYQGRQRSGRDFAFINPNVLF